MLFCAGFWSVPWWQFSCSNPPPLQCLSSSSHYPVPRSDLYQRLIVCLFRGEGARFLVSNSVVSSLNQMLLERLFLPRTHWKQDGRGKTGPMKKGEMVKVVMFTLWITEGQITLINVLSFLQSLPKVITQEKYLFFPIKILWPNSKMTSMAFLCLETFGCFLRLISILKKATWSEL